MPANVVLTVKYKYFYFSGWFRTCSPKYWNNELLVWADSWFSVPFQPRIPLLLLNHHHHLDHQHPLLPQDRLVSLLSLAPDERHGPGVHQPTVQDSGVDGGQVVHHHGDTLDTGRGISCCQTLLWLAEKWVTQHQSCAEHCQPPPGCPHLHQSRLQTICVERDQTIFFKISIFFSWSWTKWRKYM